jgi:hypothetical protein
MTLVSLLCLSLVPAAGSTEETVFLIRESALNKVSGSVGDLSGEVGGVEVKQDHPCFPDYWHTCTVTLYSGTLRWKISAPSYSIGSGRIRFSAAVSASYEGFDFSSTADTDVTISLDANPPQLKVSINSLSIPIKITFPEIGEKTLFTLALPNSYDFSLPLQVASGLAARTAGGDRNINAVPKNPRLTLQNQAVQISAEYTVW